MNYQYMRVVAALLLAVCCSQAFAQYGAGTGSMGGSRRGNRGLDLSAPRNGEAYAPPMARVNQTADKLYDLRVRLLISKEQSVTWDDFYAKAMAWAAEVAKTRSTAPDQPVLPAMQQRLTDAQNRHALMEALNDAARRMYAVLSPEQQRTADEYLAQAIP